MGRWLGAKGCTTPSMSRNTTRSGPFFFPDPLRDFALGEGGAVPASCCLAAPCVVPRPRGNCCFAEDAPAAVLARVLPAPPAPLALVCSVLPVLPDPPEPLDALAAFAAWSPAVSAAFLEDVCCVGVGSLPRRVLAVGGVPRVAGVGFNVACRRHIQPCLPWHFRSLHFEVEFICSRSVAAARRLRQRPPSSALLVLN